VARDVEAVERSCALALAAATSTGMACVENASAARAMSGITAGRWAVIDGALRCCPAAPHPADGLADRRRPEPAGRDPSGRT